MKVFKLLILIITTTLLFSGCNVKEKSPNKDALENMVVYSLEQTENIENLSDETIKALSVIYRTNHYISNNYNNFDYKSSSQKLKNLTLSTRGQILTNSNKDLSTFVFDPSNESLWQIEIKKSDILKFLKSKNLKLSSIKNISPVYNEYNELESISIGSKNISFEELQNNFNLKSNKITKIETNLSNILITGKSNSTILFDIKKVDEHSVFEQNYQQLLKHFYHDFSLITL